MNEPRTTLPTRAGGYEDAAHLLARTLRTVGVLVAVTVLFVGALSGAAVLVASKVAAASSPPVAETLPAALTAKKPLSI